MVFSFFKKKIKPPEETMPERPAARPKPLVAPVAPAALASTATPVKPVVMADLEFTSGNFPKPPQPTPAVSRAAAPVMAPAPLHKIPVLRAPEPDFTISEFERNFTESSVMAIDVDHGLDPVQADIEQVAVLFANGQDAAARSLLDVFVRSYQGSDALRFWRMYFDFLQLTGDRASFEKLSLEFANDCETSPPAWQEARLSKAVALAEPTNFELQGVLTAESGKLLMPLLLALEKKLPLRVECSKLLGCDDEFASQLLALLQRARVLGVAVQLDGTDRLLANLRPRLVAGQREHFAAWRLSFELLQRSGAQAEFEEKAVDFAISFEQSPPSWEAIAVAAVAPILPSLPTDAYYLSGDIRSCKFDDLKAVFDMHSLPVLDFSAVRRIDFFSAGQLANRIALYKHGGRETVIRSPNHLVAELMGVVGLNKLARILVPKF